MDSVSNCLVSRRFATDFPYDVVNRSNHDIGGDTSVVAIRDDDLASARGKPRQLRLYFMNPCLLISRCLPV